MSLANQLANLATRVGTEFKTVRGTIGTLASLTTTEKGSIVGAINEVRAAAAAGGATVDNISGAGAVGKDSLRATTKAEGRSAIGAGTSDLVLGTTGTTAKPGNYVPDYADIANKPAFIGAGTTAANARSAIGAGTSSLTLGTTSSTAKAGDYAPTWGEVTNKPAVIAAGADMAAARSAIGAGTSNLALGTTGTTAKAGDYVPSWSEITSKPAVIAAGVDAAAARAAIGAQSASDVDTRINGIIGGASAAMDTLGEIETILNNNGSQIGTIVTALGKRVSVSDAQTFTEAEKTQARSNIDVYSKTEIGNPEQNLVTVFEGALV